MLRWGVLDSHQKQAFGRDGYLIVAQALNRASLEPVRRHISNYIGKQIQRLHSER